MARARRLTREYDDLENWRYADIRRVTTNVGRRKLIRTVCNFPLFEADYDETNIRYWKVKINKPNLENEFIEIDVSFPDKFPFEPPNFVIVSEFSHPCIDNRGVINIINGMNWSPALTTCACLLIITSTLFPDWEETISEARQRWRTDQIKMELITKTSLDELVDF
jgi:ubiquitin-protein ligase